MFTGLVEALGAVTQGRVEGTGRTLTVADPPLPAESRLGDSVAVNGCCLTVVQRDDAGFTFQAGPETLCLTNLGELSEGSRVNLERPLRVGDRLGGHFVQGHVDAVGRIAERKRDGAWETVWFSCPPELTRYMVRKGSIAVDGVSLTLVDVLPDGFSVALIPHTLDMTTLGFKQAGDAVNLEADCLAKHVEKLLASR